MANASPTEQAITLLTESVEAIKAQLDQQQPESDTPITPPLPSDLQRIQQQLSVAMLVKQLGVPVQQCLDIVGIDIDLPDEADEGADEGADDFAAMDAEDEEFDTTEEEADFDTEEDDAEEEAMPEEERKALADWYLLHSEVKALYDALVAPGVADEGEVKALQGFNPALKLMQGNEGIMLCFMLPKEIQQQLAAAFPAEYRPDPDHITLAVFRDSILDRELSKMLLMDALRSFAVDERAFTGTIGGIGRFYTTEDDGTNAVYLSVDSRDIGAFRERLRMAMSGLPFSVANNHGYIPHITLGYVPSDTPTPDLRVAAEANMLPELRFDYLTLVWGDDQHHFRLGSTDIVTGDVSVNATTPLRMPMTAPSAPNTAEAGNTIVVDFDGVLHSYVSGWQGADIIPDDPVPGAIEFTTNALDTFHVAVVSARSGQPGGIEAMRRWMEQHSFPVDHPRLFFPSQKPPALVYIDDRAVPFRGTFPTIEVLQNFKPWYADNDTTTE